MRTVLACGCFDLLHAGHIAHLEEARAMGDHLTVALTIDDMVRKGPGRPVCPWDERAVLLRALRCVDLVVPMRIGEEAILALRPSVFVKGTDYVERGISAAEVRACSKVGAEIRYTRAAKLSTGEIIRRAKQCEF